MPTEEEKSQLQADLLKAYEELSCIQSQIIAVQEQVIHTNQLAMIHPLSLTIPELQNQSPNKPTFAPVSSSTLSSSQLSGLHTNPIIYSVAIMIFTASYDALYSVLECHINTDSVFDPDLLNLTEEDIEQNIFLFHRTHHLLDTTEYLPPEP